MFGARAKPTFLTLSHVLPSEHNPSGGKPTFPTCEPCQWSGLGQAHRPESQPCSKPTFPALEVTGWDVTAWTMVTELT